MTDAPRRGATSTPAIETRGLTVRLDRHTTLLDSVDLTVAPEEHVLLVGPSGAGKSTLLRAIAGLVTPTEGEVRLYGDVVSTGGEVRVRPEERAVGFLFQGAALWPHMTVAGTLDFVLKRRGSAKTRGERKARIAELLAAVDLEGYGKRRVPTLSGGEAQRLSLARALAAEPRILLLDEPLGPLDAPRRAALLDLFAQLSRQHGLTTLHVTHDPHEADRVATRRIELLPGGRVATAESSLQPE